MPNKKLMVIDGNSLLHRAFHALPPLMNKEGIYTNGVYGFLTMLYKVLDEYQPDYISVVFDKKGPTFRHLEFEEYKAGRVKMPNELGMQFPILKEALDKLNINRAEMDGFEADDLAGTIAKFGEQNGLEVIAVSGDKDYLQLASDKTKILLTRKGISNLEIYDKDAVLDRYELTPEQFIDLKGLMGDKSDNIPGVPGIGEKTGIKLLKEYGSIEGIYQNIDNISGAKLKEKLIEYRTQAFMSRKLSQIITEVPISISLEELLRKEPDFDELYDLYQKLEFRSLITKIQKNITEKNVESVGTKRDINYTVIRSINELKKLANDILSNRVLYIKIAIDGEHPLIDDLIGIGIKSDEDEVFYIDFVENNITEPQFLDVFKKIFEDESIKKIGHDVKNDILALMNKGVNVNGIVFDSIIGQYLINPSQNDYNLKNLSSEYLSLDIMSEDELLGTGKNKKKFSDILFEQRAAFVCNQVDVIYKIRPYIEELIEKQEMKDLFYNVEMPLVGVLADMEYTGFSVDTDKLKELGEDFDTKIEILTKAIYHEADQEFNINSPKQLGEILFDKLGLPVIKKTKTGYSTNAEVLEKLYDKHPIIEKILEYRQITKLKSTYVDGLIALIDKNTNKVHSSFNQTITTTGRISSTEPNLQNIPIKTEEGRQIRKVFVPRSEEYILVDADYSQIELRVLAHISDDPKLKEAFFTGEDIHRKTASEVFGVSIEEVTPLMRSRAKAVNFGIVYGISDYGLSRDLNITRKEAKTYIDNYLSKYVKVQEYMDSIIKDGKKKGFVYTILNRRRYLPELSSKNFNIRSFGERMAMNTPIQGSAADIIKLAMVSVYNELKKRGLKSKLILQVHDELIIEALKEEVEKIKELLSNLMENAIKLSVPLKVDMETGDSWYDTK
ncbi:DNA polymerase I [Brassicibacter mesophilus]|uniref:DNA polymerase I n=1 Tax=Brassicibacter mesophilus TaxID=745119 RepID=UPI003D21D19A